MSTTPTGAAAFARPSPDDPLHLRLAFELVGLSEIVGSRHQQKILEFFAEAGHAWVKDDETAWCAAFVHAVLGRAGIAGTGSLAARSYMQWSTAITKPRRGDVAVFKRGNSSWQGHVAFYLGEDAKRIHVLGGNQSNAVTVASYPRSALLGFRKVPGATRQQVKPAVAPIAPPASAVAPDAETIALVQRRLRELGYTEVGKVDGIMGPLTENAILIFRKDNGLPLSSRIDASLKDKLFDGSAKPRTMSAARETATTKEVREQVPEAKASGQTRAVGFWGMVSAAAVAAGDFVFGNLSGARGMADQVKSLLGAVPLPVYLALVGGVLGFIWLKGRAGEKAAVEAYREGARR